MSQVPDSNCGARFSVLGRPSGSAGPRRAESGRVMPKRAPHHKRPPLRIRRLPLASAAVVAALIMTPLGRPQTPATRSPAAVINQYCVTCHNARLKTAGLVLDPSELARAGSNPELWEKVDRKLRSYAMPPAGAPRPDEATYQAVASYLETELDRASAAKPNPGKPPPVHRLSRTEYENAVRDLLALDSLPKEMDYSVLLPPDNTSSGFDNIADLLFVSPAVMERYLDAAAKISRLAVGDPSQPLMVNIYRVSS